MPSNPALFGGIMLGAAVWLEIYAVAFWSPGFYWIIVIPALFFLAGLFVAGATKDQAQPLELAGGGAFVAVGVGFVGWFWVIYDLMIASLLSLGAGLLILFGLVFIMGGSSPGY